ncbi:MAG: hypothetical protein ISR65_00475 [Bacteriovoracaceae bacterium]|nr:hypothetical protein [Bacteriovoracaceae bacterium]
MNVTIKNSIITFFITIQILFSFALAENVIDDLSEGDEIAFDESTLADEQIQKISFSRRIFVITNANSSFYKGDYVSIILDMKLVARALVARIFSGTGAIKILKIYSLPLWRKLKPSLDVQILRGDDSYFRRSKKKAPSDELEEGKILDESDLFNSTMLSDDLSLDEDSARAIKPDNLVSISYGFVKGLNDNEKAASYKQFLGSWGYQMGDNIWAEVRYGQNLVEDFPGVGVDTAYQNVTLCLKYTIKAPFYSYLQPYFGYQMLSAKSPGAGTGTTLTPEQKAKELRIIDNLNTKGIVFGATILKRLVPGWFMKLDIGADIMALGFAIEF